MTLLSLEPLNDSFSPKRIPLVNGERVKIGREMECTDGTRPTETNGRFGTKVLSRQHAELWEEEGKIFIKDTSSMNGTYINGQRLSPSAEESTPAELKTGDTLEIGINVVGEDKETILHRKVVAQVTCIFE